jgi:hypothetical protein
MPKLIDYPRTSYTGAWELAEVTDDTGGKCTVETAARKLNRKVSGSFKAIIGSAVKFGLLTSKRELLTTTTLFKRIKHAYDKQEELLFHREAFLTPVLFSQICRKFRSRELPVQMLDIMLIREFGVEEINAPGVAKAFVDGCRMVGVLDERNVIADIDAFKITHPIRRELASPPLSSNAFRIAQDDNDIKNPIDSNKENIKLEMVEENESFLTPNEKSTRITTPIENAKKAIIQDTDAIASLFGLFGETKIKETARAVELEKVNEHGSSQHYYPDEKPALNLVTTITNPAQKEYQIQVNGPGVNTNLSITDEEDIAIAIALLEKIRRQLKS